MSGSQMTSDPGAADSLEFQVVGPVYRFQWGGRWFVSFDVRWVNHSPGETADIGPAYDGDVITVSQGVYEIPQSGELIGAMLPPGETLERRLLYYQFTPRSEPEMVTIEYRRKSQVRSRVEARTRLLSQQGLVIGVEPQGVTGFEFGPHPLGLQELIIYRIRVENPHDEARLFDPFALQCAWGNQRSGHHSKSDFNAVMRVEAHSVLDGRMASQVDPQKEPPKQVKVSYLGQVVGEFTVAPGPDHP